MFQTHHPESVHCATAKELYNPDITQNYRLHRPCKNQPQIRKPFTAFNGMSTGSTLTVLENDVQTGYAQPLEKQTGFTFQILINPDSKTRLDRPGPRQQSPNHTTPVLPPAGKPTIGSRFTLI